MHRTVAFVFKLIGISIMALILFDTAVMLADAVTTNGRIQAQASLMQQELAKNNYLSEDAIATFKGEYVDNGSGSITGRGLDYVIGLSKVYYNYEINEDEIKEVKEYGDYHTLRITTYINPWHYYFSGTVNNGEGIGKVESYGTVTYVYYVPCLRYIK